MARNGSGTYSRAVADYQFDTVVSETDVNTEMDDIATALTASLAKDGQTVPTANLPMGTYRHTGVGNGSARTDYAAVGQVQDSTVSWAGTSTGTDTVAAAVSPAITAYAAGQRFAFKAGGTNTGATTVNINSVGAKAVQKNGAALVAGDITANDIVVVVYDGTQFQMVSPARTPVLTAGGIATAALADDAVTLAKMAAGTAGNLITYDASGNPAAVATGTATHVLTSNGAGAAPTFQASSSVSAATQADMEAASSTSAYVSPGRQHFHPGAPKAWVKFSDAAAIFADYGVASVDDDGTSNFGVNWDTAFSTANYHFDVSVLLSAIAGAALHGATEQLVGALNGVGMWTTAPARSESNLVAMMVSAHGDFA